MRTNLPSLATEVSLAALKLQTCLFRLPHTTASPEDVFTPRLQAGFGPQLPCCGAALPSLPPAPRGRQEERGRQQAEPTGAAAATAHNLPDDCQPPVICRHQADYYF